MKKTLLISLAAIVAAGVIGAGIVSAHGLWGSAMQLEPEDLAARYIQMFQNQANLFGISVDQFKQYWSEGKDLPEIAEELGISQDQLRQRMQEQMQARLEEQLNALVGQGVLSQEQAQNRLEWMQNHPQKGRGHMGMGMRFFR